MPNPNPNKPSLRRITNQLARTGGNVSAAAKALKMDAGELRRLTRRKAGLMDAALEAAEQALDQAEAIIYDGLKSPDKTHRLLAASQILRMSPAARRRRW